MKSEVINMYLRLVGYSQGMELVNWFNDKYEKDSSGKYTKSYANVTVGGFSIQGTDEQLQEAMKFVNNKDWRHEFTFNHPTEVTKGIVENLKKESKIN